MNKEEKIKEAYGEYFEKCNPDENGWCMYGNFVFLEAGVEPFGNYETKEHIGGVYKWRPKSISGIQDNNGWVKLQGLPNEIKDRCAIWIETKNGDIEYLKENEFLPVGYAVAYKVVEKPKKRIY